MQSQDIEIIFPSFDRECIKFLKILREIETNFSKNGNASRCQLGFQVEDKQLHLYTAQQTLTHSQSNNVFMLATFNKGFYKIANYNRPFCFGVRLKGFISKLLICKKEQIDQIKFVISKEKVIFDLCDKNTKGWITHTMVRQPLELRNFDYELELNPLIDIVDIKSDWMEKNKKGNLPENLILQEDRIDLQMIQKNYVCCERSMKPGRDIENYNY